MFYPLSHVMEEYITLVLNQSRQIDMKFNKVLCYIFYYRVKTEESLFIARIRDEIIKREYLYCSCSNDTLTKDNILPTANCSWHEALPFCPPLNWGSKECLIKGRRSAYDDLEIDIPGDMIAFEESKLNVSYY